MCGILCVNCAYVVCKWRVVYFVCGCDILCVWWCAWYLVIIVVCVVSCVCGGVCGILCVWCCMWYLGCIVVCVIYCVCGILCVWWGVYLGWIVVPVVSCVCCAVCMVGCVVSWVDCGACGILRIVCVWCGHSGSLSQPRTEPADAHSAVLRFQGCPPPPRPLSVPPQSSLLVPQAEAKQDVEDKLLGHKLSEQTQEKG